MPPSESSALLRRLYEEAAGQVDGARLVARGWARPATAITHVLALGKAAGPMWEGVVPQLESGVKRLIITTDAGARALATDVHASDHPRPSGRSEAAADDARAFVASVPEGGRLLVLLSGGASSLMAAPAPLLTLAEKAAVTDELARAGAPIAALNILRKHLSRVKGGRLALLTRAPTRVLVLADVLGESETELLATVGSGPFTLDPSTLADARAVLQQHDVVLPASLAHLWDEPALALAFETPKAREAFAHVEASLIGRPRDLQRHAERAAEAAGCEIAPLFPGTDSLVNELAAAIVARLARAIAETSPRPRDRPLVLVGHGEPRLVLPAGPLGQGGRASHLAWAVARALDRWPATSQARVAFLAASTDDRDGRSSAHGAFVDGTTFARARAGGLDPEAAGAGFDTATLFAALADDVHGSGRSNVLDLHLALVL